MYQKAPPAITIEALGKTYGEGAAVHILSGIELDIPCGEMVVLLCPY